MPCCHCEHPSRCDRLGLCQEFARKRLAASRPWQPMETAPRDTEIEILLYHPTRQYAKGDAKRQWEQVVRAKWIDFNGGGWTWHGMYGIEQGWRPLTP